MSEVNPHNGPFEPYTSVVDTVNKFLRPSTVAAIALMGVLFLGGLGTIMLYRFAVHGEINWEGLAAFCTMVLGPVMQQFQNRHSLKLAGMA